MSDASFDAELKQVFLAEAQEILDDCEMAFIDLEGNPGNSQILDKIFRLVHSIKGSAYVAGFNSLGAFAHSVENLLGDVRSGRTAVNPELTDVLLASNDMLKTFVRELRGNPDAEIDVRSLANRISTFQARLSYDPAAGAPAGAGPGTGVHTGVPAPGLGMTTETVMPGKPAEADPQATVLVCDDEPVLVRLLAQMLESEGYCVIEAVTPFAALEAFRSNPVDVILTDLKMPDMDGIQFVEKVRAMNRFVPIVFVSGHSARDHFKEYLRLGVEGFIEKPFSDVDILTVVSRMVREKRLRDAVIEVSRMAMHAYIAMEKMMNLGDNDREYQRERHGLEVFLDNMRRATTHLLACERKISAANKAG